MAVFAAAFISAVPGRCNVAGQRLAVCTRNSGRSRMALDVAVLISGGGRSLENIFERIESGELADVKVKCVVASKASAGGLRRAEARGIPTRVLPVKDFESVDKFSEAITSTLVQAGRENSRAGRHLRPQGLLMLHHCAVPLCTGRICRRPRRACRLDALLQNS